jgi:hypothetical protein
MGTDRRRRPAASANAIRLIRVRYLGGSVALTLFFAPLARTRIFQPVTMSITHGADASRSIGDMNRQCGSRT